MTADFWAGLAVIPGPREPAEDVVAAGTYRRLRWPQTIGR